jgi:hypothetical protein
MSADLRLGEAQPTGKDRSEGEERVSVVGSKDSWMIRQTADERDGTYRTNTISAPKDIEKRLARTAMVVGFRACQTDVRCSCSSKSFTGDFFSV